MRVLKKEDLVKAINNNLAINETAVKLGFHRTTVSKVAKKYGFKFKKDNRGGLNKIVTHNPFKDLNNPETNYWLGYLAADGWLSTNKWTISFLQYSEDYEQVVLYRDFIDTNLSLHQIKGCNGQSVNFGNKSTYNFLIALGFSPRKAKTFEYKGNLNGDFLRGYFDGDGSVSMRRPKITTSSELFRDQIIQIFNTYNIDYSFHRKGLKKDCYDIFILLKGRQSFYDLIYENEGPYLKRKHDALLAILMPNKNRGIKRENPEEGNPNRRVH